MTEIIKLSAVSRDKVGAGKYTLAEVYGSKIKNQHVAIDSVTLVKTLKLSGMSLLIDLAIDDQPAVKVLIKEVQRHPIKNHIIHVDFQQVDLANKIKTQLNIKHVGTSHAAAILGGILVTNLQKLDIECLPEALLGNFEIDLSKLENLGDVLRVEDLEIPEGIEIKNDARAVIVSVLAPRKAKEGGAEEDEEETKTEGEEAKPGDAKPAEGDAKPGEAKPVEKK